MGEDNESGSGHNWKRYAFVVVVLLGGFWGYSQIKESEKQPLPVSVSFRDAMMGPGLVAIFRNNSGTMLEVTALFASPDTARASTSRQLVLSPKDALQIGHAEGWPFAPGQRITLSNARYREAQIVVP